MTVTNLYEPNYYSGNGVTTVFSYSFTCLLASWIVVAVNGVVISNANYTVALNSNNVGGTVTFNVAPGIFDQIAITLNVPDLQLTSFPVEGALPQFTLENAFDTITLITQQLTNALTRTIMQSVFAPLGFTLQIPDPIPGDALGWDPTGTTLINIPPIVTGPTGPTGATGGTGPAGPVSPVGDVHPVFARGSFTSSGANADANNINIASCVRNSTGNYTVTFTTPAAKDDYALSITSTQSIVCTVTAVAFSTTQVRVQTYSSVPHVGAIDNGFLLTAVNAVVSGNAGATGATGATGASGTTYLKAFASYDNSIPGVVQNFGGVLSLPAGGNSSFTLTDIPGTMPVIQASVVDYNQHDPVFNNIEIGTGTTLADGIFTVSTYRNGVLADVGFALTVYNQ